MVLLARDMLRDPYWPLHAAAALGDPPVGQSNISAPRPGNTARAIVPQRPQELCRLRINLRSIVAPVPRGTLPIW